MSPTTPTSSATSGSASCTTPGQCSFVRDALQQYYYWYRELPNPDPAGFGSPEAYLDSVRYRTLDSSFSYITSKASSDAFFSESQFIGFGLSYKRTGDLELRLTQTFPGSPAAEAGLDRGHYLVSVNGKPVADLVRTGEIATVFGPETVGVTAEIVWRAPGGPERRATLTKRLVTIPTVSQTSVVNSGGTRVGYIHFRNFVQPSVEALNGAFQQLRDQGATELVLDVRYNGGGLVSVAQHLGGLIAGAPLVGQVFVQFTHNDKQTSRNTSYRFETKPQALGVSRLVVIATPASASASEAMINGLRPVHGRQGRGRPHLRQAGGPVRLRLLRQGALPGGLPGHERARPGRLLLGHPCRLRRRATTSIARSPTPARPRSPRRSRCCATAAAAASLRRPRSSRRASASGCARSPSTAGTRRPTPGKPRAACYHLAQPPPPESFATGAPGDWMTPERIGKYQIVGKLGQGAMGEVFRGHDPVLNRDVAIKRISSGLDADETLKKRFKREAEAVALLNHPHIITVYELGFEGEQMYMAMELLEGMDLKHAMAQRKLGLAEKLAVMEQMCEGLAFAHERDLVHRDLKPANIHILPGGKVKIMDFGLARMSGSDMTSTGTVMGTPHYMSPEQVRGMKADARSDVFALGCVFYELFSGRKPFDAESMHGVLFKVMQEEPAPLTELAPELPHPYVQVIERTLAKEPADRFQSAGELLGALRLARAAGLAPRPAERPAERSGPGTGRDATRIPARSVTRAPERSSVSRGPGHGARNLVIGLLAALVVILLGYLALRPSLGGRHEAEPPPQVAALLKDAIATRVQLAQRRLDAGD